MCSTITSTQTSPIYSEEIIITVPERTCIYDKTRIEVNCTRPVNGKTDKVIRAGPEDDGTSVVTKSSKSGSAVCGRVVNGRALPLVFI